MLIMSGRSGGLANRLFVFGHVIANAIEFQYSVINLSFLKYAKQFEATRNDLFCRYPAQHSRLHRAEVLQSALYYSVNQLCHFAPRTRLLESLVRVRDILPKGNEQKNSNLAAQGSTLVLVRGLVFRDFLNFRKHAQAIRDFFVPAEPHLSNVSRLVEQARDGCDILIGVHIRQGDYAGWCDGRYFFEIPTYLNCMAQAVDLFPERQVKFLICSNVVQEAAAFKNFAHVMGTNHIIEDIYAFARCDYIIAPPSTYSGWASFYGQVPVLTVMSSGGRLSLEDAKVWQG